MQGSMLHAHASPAAEAPGAASSWGWLGHAVRPALPAAASKAPAHLLLLGVPLKGKRLRDCGHREVPRRPQRRHNLQHRGRAAGGRRRGRQHKRDGAVGAGVDVAAAAGVRGGAAHNALQVGWRQTPLCGCRVVLLWQQDGVGRGRRIQRRFVHV